MIRGTADFYLQKYSFVLTAMEILISNSAEDLGRAIFVRVWARNAEKSDFSL